MTTCDVRAAGLAAIGIQPGPVVGRRSDGSFGICVVCGDLCATADEALPVYCGLCVQTVPTEIIQAQRKARR